MDAIKTCSTCLFERAVDESEPCATCMFSVGQNSMWQPKEPTEIEKARRAGKAEGIRLAAEMAREAKHNWSNPYEPAPAGWDEADNALEELAVDLLARAEEVERE